MTKTNLLAGRVVIARQESSINGELVVVRDLAFGTYIHGGGLPQSGGLAEEIWRSTLNKLHGAEKNIKSCLIVGLGGGSIAKIVRKNWPGSKITGIDIDNEIVELGKKYLGLAKSDVEIIIADAEEAIENLDSKFDLICFDTYVGDSFPEKFEKLSFIKKVAKKLNKDGIAVFNRLYGPLDRDNAINFEKTLLKVFKNVDRYYPEANIMFACGL